MINKDKINRIIDRLDDSAVFKMIVLTMFAALLPAAIWFY